jgi:hypothetical protein
MSTIFAFCSCSCFFRFSFLASFLSFLLSGDASPLSSLALPSSLGCCPQLMAISVMWTRPVVTFVRGNQRSFSSSCTRSERVMVASPSGSSLLTRSQSMTCSFSTSFCRSFTRSVNSSSQTGLRLLAMVLLRTVVSLSVSTT